MKNFITPQELAELRSDYILFDVRGSEYVMGHIAGAFALDLEGDLSGLLEQHGGRHPLPDMSKFAALMESYGVTEHTPVIIYDSWIFTAGRLWWMLRYLGHTNVKVLSGGIERWYREGYPLTKEKPQQPASPSTWNWKIQSHMQVSHDEVFRVSESREKIIVDARAPERYAGTEPDMDGMSGHVPGAVNYFFQLGYDGNGPLPVEELQKLYAPLVQDEREAIVYCGSGVTAPVAMLTMDEVGVDTLLYVGSSSDWVSYPDFPIEKGVNTL